MAKQQKAKTPEVKVKKTVSKSQSVDQFMAKLNKKVQAAMKQYDYNKDKGGQYIGSGRFMSGEQVKHACSSKKVHQ